jgi:hypothetical protein
MPSLEHELVALDEQLEAFRKVTATLQSTVRRAQAASRTGHVRDIERRLLELRERAAEVATAAGSLEQIWSFDVAAHMEGGGYSDELKRAAAELGVELFERDGRIYAFPLLVRLEPRERAMRVGRKSERRIRPSFAARLLQQAQKRPQRFDAQRFLELLRKAYLKVDQGGERVVPLADIHDLLTLLPGADYPMEEFARDLLLLDRQPDLRTRDGCRFELPASTGSKGKGRRIVVYDENGGEHLYVGIRFVRED